MAEWETITKQTPIDVFIDNNKYIVESCLNGEWYIDKSSIHDKIDSVRKGKNMRYREIPLVPLSLPISLLDFIERFGGYINHQDNTIRYVDYTNDLTIIRTFKEE